MLLNKISAASIIIIKTLKILVNLKIGYSGLRIQSKQSQKLTKDHCIAITFMCVYV